MTLCIHIYVAARVSLVTDATLAIESLALREFPRGELVRETRRFSSFNGALRTIASGGNENVKTSTRRSVKCQVSKRFAREVSRWGEGRFRQRGSSALLRIAIRISQTRSSASDSRWPSRGFGLLGPLRLMAAWEKLAPRVSCTYVRSDSDVVRHEPVRFVRGHVSQGGS